MNKKLWGGRFSKSAHPIFEKFSSSIETDWRLAECDLIGSYIHIHVLFEAKLISKNEFTALKKAIKSILESAQKGKISIDISSEDVHTYIQNLLEQKAGKAALKLQTCRSRNDQV
ncbi:MAG TPA: lyase family protein, partial [Candidatus Omnitrophota bacterium]|nr:lyase family protein [Candidatus Omnitrophota bacterium]